MYFESLAIEIYSTKAGWEPVKPPRTKGDSGVEHRFSFLGVQGDEGLAFDLCTDVGQVEVLRSYVKQLDTRVKVVMVCLKGRPTEEGLALAKEYGMRILSPAEIGTYFDRKEWALPLELAVA